MFIILFSFILIYIYFFQTVSENLELSNHVNNLPDAVYVLDKLFQMSLHNSCLAAQRDINVKELETKMQQVLFFIYYLNFYNK